MISIDLSGRTALITGASGELGRAIARTLAEAGADIIVHFHRNKGSAEEIAAHCGALGRKTLVVQADITDPSSIAAMHASIAAGFAAPDIIVNNAVIQYEWMHLLDQPLADFESQFKSCVMHNVIMAKTFVPAMIDKGWGRVIGINTECAMQCEEDQSAYASAKRGMDGILRVLAREIGPSGITVNQVAPGWTVSEHKPETDASKEYRDALPLRRRAQDQDIANAVLFLASDLASFITGAFIPVCGGSVMPTI